MAKVLKQELQRRKSPRPRIWSLLGLAALLGSTVLLMFWLFARSEVKPVAHSDSKSDLVKFAHAEQGAAYHQAINQGSQRAIQVLEDALEQSQRQENPDQALLARLQQELDAKRSQIRDIQPVKEQ